MTFKQLRHQLAFEGKDLPVRWTKSGIVELAHLNVSGSISIFNAISRKRYTLPKRGDELYLEVITDDSLIPLGALLPKSMRKR